MGTKKVGRPSAAHRAWLVLAALAVSVVGTIGLASAAGAATPVSSQGSVPAGTSPICQTSSSAPNSNKTLAATANQYLPINRWSESSSEMHTRLTGAGITTGLGDFEANVQRNVVVAGGLTVGNTMWSASSALVSAANDFCVAKSAGGYIDNVAATFGNAIGGPGSLIAVFVVIAILSLAWRASRGRAPEWGKVFRIVATVGFFYVTVYAATASSPQPLPPGVAGPVATVTTPAPLSPSWDLTHLYSAINQVVSIPSSALATMAATPGPPPPNQLSCYYYDKALVNDYNNAWGSNVATQSPATVPLAVSSLWMQAGLKAYSTAQFGSNSYYQENASCHLLDQNAGILPADQAVIQDQANYIAFNGKLPPIGWPNQAPLSTVLKGSMNSSGLFAYPNSTPVNVPLAANPQSLWLTGGFISNNDQDRSAVAMAACTYSGEKWHVTNGFAQLGSTGGSGGISGVIKGILPIVAGVGGAIAASQIAGTPPAHAVVTTSDCANAYTQPLSGWNPGSSSFEWKDNAGAISTTASDVGTVPAENAAGFLNNLHGTSNSQATVVAILYAVCSVVVFLVLGVLAGAVLLAKLALLISFALMTLLLVAAMFPGSSATSRVGNYAKHVLSLMIFASAAGFILSIVAVLAEFLSGLGASVTGSGSALSEIWTSLSVIGAIWILHHVMKKMGAPSPFKLGSALAYSSAAGGMAGAAVGGMAGGRMGKRILRNAGYAVAGERIGSVLGRGRGFGRRRRTGGMEADGGAGPRSGGAVGASGGANGSRASGGANGSGGAGVPAGVPVASRNRQQVEKLAQDRHDRQAGKAAARAASRASARALNGPPRFSGRGASVLNRADSSLRSVRRAATTRIELAGERFMANPVKSSLRIAGKAGLIMAAPYIAVPAMVAHHGIKKVSSAKRDIRAGRANRNDQYLEAGRAMRTARAPGGAGPP